VSATQSDPNTANNSASLQTSVVAPSADMAVSVTDAPDPVAVNETLTYTVTATNNGPSGATGVTVTNAVPSGVTFLSATSSQGSCSGSGTVSCSVGSLGVGGSVSITIKVTAPGTTGTLSDTAGVSSNQPDPVSGNNSAAASTSVVAPSTLANISTRAPVGTGESVAVGGFIVTGSGTKQVLIRGFGPTLSGAVGGPLANPVLDLYADQDNDPLTPAVLVVSNDNWGTALTTCPSPVVSCGSPQDIRNTGRSADSYAPTNPNRHLDAALLVTLSPGTYTAALRGVNNDTGVGLVAINDMDMNPTATLVNISTRAAVGTGENVAVGGFIISGTAPKTVLLRGFGPTLSGAVAGALANPVLDLYADQDSNPSTPATLVVSNDDWGTALSACPQPVVNCGSPQDIRNTGRSADNYAPTNPNRHLDAALLVTLPPGTYTVGLRGLNNGTGVGLVAVNAIAP
jgi:uncharacterized repeat protein (TIGR01451 family)